jgi:hypothetical protein
MVCRKKIRAATWTGTCAVCWKIRMELYGSAGNIAPESRPAPPTCSFCLRTSPSPLREHCVSGFQGPHLAGNSGQGLYYWQNGRLNKLPDPSIESSIINALAEDQRGRLWVGTHSGLICYGSDLQRVRGRFPGNEITCLLVDRHGVLWIGTSGEGLIRYKNGSFLRCGKLMGWPATSFWRWLKIRKAVFGSAPGME